MKKLIAVVGMVAVGLSAYGQGSILFNNVGPGFTAPVSQLDGTLVPAGAGFTAELLAGADASSLTAISGTTTFIQAGYFLGGQRVLPGLAPGSQPFFQVQVWENLGGTVASYGDAAGAGAQYGQSTVFQLGGTAVLGNPTGQPPVPAPALVGMTAFSLVPEPATYALLALGAGALFLRRRK